tara:strand:- start:416 stop:871 length:456 start_codon:yes stop_codon:yes gene_type:complete
MIARVLNQIATVKTNVRAPIACKEIKMKYLILLCFLFVPLSAEAQQPERKVIKPPVVKSVPRDFTRPQPQRPAGFGKQEWQRPQQQQVRPSHNYRHGSIIIGRPYVHPYQYRMYRQPAIHHYYYGPPVIIQPQPVPAFPSPFSGFFFQFRF